MPVSFHIDPIKRGENIDQHNRQFMRKLAVDVINSNPYRYGLTRSGRLVEMPRPPSPNGLKVAVQADRHRKPRTNAGRLIRAAKTAGLTVERVESDQHGKVSVIIANTGAPSAPMSATDLDQWLAKRRERAKGNADQS
jgi:hypothetical protein